MSDWRLGTKNIFAFTKKKPTGVGITNEGTNKYETKGWIAFVILIIPKLT